MRNNRILIRKVLRERRIITVISSSRRTVLHGVAFYND
jgi:hypothetical protein